MKKNRTVNSNFLKFVKTIFQIFLTSKLIILPTGLYAQTFSATTPSPELNLEINQGLQGQYLIALFTVSTSPAVGYRPDSLHVDRITGRIVKPITNTNLTLESIELLRIPNFKSYNNLILIVSPSPQYIWKNSLDSTVPSNQPEFINPIQTQYSALKVIKSSLIESKAKGIITVP